MTKYNLSENGVLYNDDCLKVLPTLTDESFDLIFADPPFNLDKFYNEKVNDSLSKEQYLNWCKEWISASVTKLKDGGAFFLWNIPKWNTFLSSFLNEHLTFRNWITVDFKSSMPIKGKLYPAHYSLLYYVRGDKPNTFNPDRLPLEVCQNCFQDLKDYGGYKEKLNKLGMSLPDIWLDITPVRHKKYKNRKANELPVRLLDRIIQMSTLPGDSILDVFSGSGTALAVADIKKRNWTGIEIGDIDVIKERFHNLERDTEILNDIRSGYNNLFEESTKKEREFNGIWV